MKLARSVFVTVAVFCLAAVAAAQERRPLSPPGVASTPGAGKWSAPDKDGERTYTGGKWIEITYGRPMLRGRTNIFGRGADYGKQVNASAPLWRAGANVTTTLKTEVPLEIGGKRPQPGEYTLLAEVKEAGWALVVSKRPRQEEYDANERSNTCAGNH